MKITVHYEKEKQRFLESCTQCGLCAGECPILPYTEIGGISAQEIQEDVFDFMEGGIPNQRAYTKAFACMECFKCTAEMCPEDLNPMLVNELFKRDYISRGLEDRAYGDAMKPDSPTGYYHSSNLGTYRTIGAGFRLPFSSHQIIKFC